MRGQRPPGREGKALEKGLIRMAELSGDAEGAAAELKTLPLPDASSLNRYLARLEVCDGDLGAARQAHEYFEKHPDLNDSFASLAEVTPGKVDETLAHCEHLRQTTRPGPEREKEVKRWVRVLREEQLRTPQQVADFLKAPPPAAPAPAPIPSQPAPAPVEPEPPTPTRVAAELLKKHPVEGLSEKKLARTLDTAAEYLNGLDRAQAEVEQVLAGTKKPEELDRYLSFLKLSDGQNGQALAAFQHARTEPQIRSVEHILCNDRNVADLQWLESKLPKDADLVASTKRFVDFTRDNPDNALFERTLALPGEAVPCIRKLEEVGMTCSEAVDDLAYLAKNGFKAEDYELLRALRERTPTGGEVRRTLDFLRRVPDAEVREQRKKAYLKLVEVGDDPIVALEDLKWLATDRPGKELADATETYLDLLGKVGRDQRGKLRDCYQKIHEGAPPAASTRSWFRKPVTYEGAYGTLLEFDPEPSEALSDLRLLQKHSSSDLRGGLKDLRDLFKMANARDGEAVRTAYELLQEPPRYMNGDQVKKLLTQLTQETDDLGLGSRMTRLLVKSHTEGEFRARRQAFNEYLELGNSTSQTVSLLETAERCLPPTDELLKIHPVLLAHNKERPPELVATALEQAQQALARGRVDGQSSSALFRSYLNVLCKSDRTSDVEKLGEVLRTEGASAYSMTQIMEPMLDGCGSVAKAVDEFHFVRDLRDKEWPDCEHDVEQLARTHAGSLLVLRQVGREPYSGARDLMTWAFEHRNLDPQALLTEVGRRLVMDANFEKARAEALEHFENGGRIRDTDDHLVIGGVRIGKKFSDDGSGQQG